jgi:hypothetical protein
MNDGLDRDAKLQRYRRQYRARFGMQLQFRTGLAYVDENF